VHSFSTSPNLRHRIYLDVSHLSAKNYQNWWKFDEVLTKTNMLSFLGDTVYLFHVYINVDLCSVDWTANHDVIVEYTCLQSSLIRQLATLTVKDPQQS